MGLTQSYKSKRIPILKISPMLLRGPVVCADGGMVLSKPFLWLKNANVATSEHFIHSYQFCQVVSVENSLKKPHPKIMAFYFNLCETKSFDVLVPNDFSFKNFS